MKTPELIEGNIHIDDRGKITFFNRMEFMQKIKRVYIIKNFDKDVIRAFHGHKKEEKYFLAVHGSVLVCIGKVTAKNHAKRFVLSSDDPSILYVPGGYANGFRILEEGTELVVFSTATLLESKDDDIRLPWDHCGAKIWETENR